MRRVFMRAYGLIALTVLGCGGKNAGDDGVEPDPKGWTIDVDMSATNRFVDPADSTTWPVAGAATATEGLSTIAVNDAPVSIGDGGAFATTVMPAPGLSRVSVLVTDEAGHTRKGDRSLLAARFLPDGVHNP